MSRNVVKRLANPISINSLLDVIGQSDNYVIDIFSIEQSICSGYRRLSRNGEEKTCFSLGRK